jgi:hypothetical protein
MTSTFPRQPPQPPQTPSLPIYSTFPRLPSRPPQPLQPPQPPQAPNLPFHSTFPRLRPPPPLQPSQPPQPPQPPQTTDLPSSFLKTPPPPLAVISVLNPTPVPSKPSGNYSHVNFSPSPTKRSILRPKINNNNNNVSNSSKSYHRVSFDLTGSPVIERQFEPKLAPKYQNPSMPDLSKLILSRQTAKNNPFLNPPKNNKNPFRQDDLDNNSLAVKLGEDFFTSLFLSSSCSTNQTTTTTTTITDPWSASKKQPQNNFTASTSAVSAASNFSTTSTAAVLAPITNNQGTPNQHQQHPNVEINVDSVEDRYAALKDLDDIFKSTVVVNDVKSTGASIFGAASQTPSQQQQHGGLNPSPTVTALGASPSVFGPSPTNNLPPGRVCTFFEKHLIFRNI